MPKNSKGGPVCYKPCYSVGLCRSFRNCFCMREIVRNIQALKQTRKRLALRTIQGNIGGLTHVCMVGYLDRAKETGRKRDRNA